MGRGAVTGRCESSRATSAIPPPRYTSTSRTWTTSSHWRASCCTTLIGICLTTSCRSRSTPAGRRTTCVRAVAERRRWMSWFDLSGASSATMCCSAGGATGGRGSSYPWSAPSLCSASTRRFWFRESRCLSDLPIAEQAPKWGQTPFKELEMGSDPTFRLKPCDLERHRPDALCGCGHGVDRRRTANRARGKYHVGIAARPGRRLLQGEATAARGPRNRDARNGVAALVGRPHGQQRARPAHGGRRVLRDADDVHRRTGEACRLESG